MERGCGKERGWGKERDLEKKRAWRYDNCGVFGLERVVSICLGSIKIIFSTLPEVLYSDNGTMS